MRCRDVPYARKISFKYLLLVSLVYFLLVGLYTIGTDLYHGKLTWGTFWFNLLFIIPFFIRKKVVHLAFGILFLIIWGYCLFGGILLSIMHPEQLGADEAGSGILILVALLCSIVLWRRGMSYAFD